jgi:hypothetical protein
MRCEDLMSPDLVSEVVLVGSAALMLAVLIVILVAALTHPAALAWQPCGESLGAM